MCDCKACQKPSELIGKPGECSPEQIQKCHGDGAQTLGPESTDQTSSK